MDQFSAAQNQPITLTSSAESQVYGLLALAMALTVLGVYAGMQYTAVLMASGMHIVLLIAELGIIFTARLWMRSYPLNYILFGIFPLLSGFTVTPYILYVLAGYANGGTILLNAVSATVFMTAAVAVFARTTSWNLSVMGRALLLGLVGLILLGVAQIFIPSLQSTQFEILLSGAGIVFFAAFTAYDLQRIQNAARVGANPFLLALSLYLDIFNLFLYILRFMLAIAGERR
ncbi:MAG: Bax inhibitor-1 family protein [Candidatus Peribacteraceae bacterium]